MLDLGRYSSGFDYIDGNSLDVEIGDIVLVKLRGRLHAGLVVKKTNFNKGCSELKYLSIERILQKKVFQDWWREWLEKVAIFYKVSDLQMFKTAFPPGWISRSTKIYKNFTYNIWLSSIQNTDKNINNLSDKQKRLINKIASQGGMWQNDLIKLGYTSNFIKSLVDQNLIKKEKCKKFNSPTYNSSKNDDGKIKPPLLTNQQREAIQSIELMDPGEVLLLWGETGSGKTEVYLRVTESQLSKGKSCLILVPEIGLVPQLIDRFVARFKNVFEYHSNCSPKHRQLVWRQIVDSKDPVIVVGTRSSVFLPIENLGIIILDEEHDCSYKQESPMPCYDAKAIAIDRADKFKIKVVLGSATPSLNTWKKVSFQKEYKLARMPERISITKVPEINIVDMREEYKKGNKKILSSQLLNLLSKLRNNNEQALILIPRRGYSGFLSCRDCGYVVNCPNCDLALTVHVGSKGTSWLNCHWCDFKTKYIKYCPDCNSNAFKPFGIGTQRVMEFLSNELPYLRLKRFDRDTTSGKDGHRNMLEDFSKGNADVLVGTQMLAKGIDLPNVTLSVVIAADSLLHRPDISSEEKSLQLFLQLAGRAGRANKAGNVIVQTYQPSHPVIQYLKKRNYQGFLTENMKLRKDANLFPFCKVIILKISGINNQLTEEISNQLAEYIKPFCVEVNWKLIGPVPSMISKIGKKYRWQILLYGPDNSASPILSDNKIWNLIPKDVFLNIDVNPVEI